MNLHDKLIKTFSNKFHFNSIKRVAGNLLHMWNKVIIPWIDFYIPKNDPNNSYIFRIMFTIKTFESGKK